MWPAIDAASRASEADGEGSRSARKAREVVFEKRRQEARLGSSNSCPLFFAVFVVSPASRDLPLTLSLPLLCSALVARGSLCHGG